MSDGNPASWEFGNREEKRRVAHEIRTMLLDEPYGSERAGALQDLYRRLRYIEAVR